MLFIVGRSRTRPSYNDPDHLQVLLPLLIMALETQRPADVPGGHDATTRHLEEQAAVAALYVTKQGEGSQAKTGQEFLDSNHRLSSAGEFRTSEYLQAHCEQWLTYVV